MNMSFMPMPLPLLAPATAPGGLTATTPPVLAPPVVVAATKPPGPSSVVVVARAVTGAGAGAVSAVAPTGVGGGKPAGAAGGGGPPMPSTGVLGPLLAALVWSSSCLPMLSAATGARPAASPLPNPSGTSSSRASALVSPSSTTSSSVFSCLFFSASCTSGWGNMVGSGPGVGSGRRVTALGSSLSAICATRPRQSTSGSIRGVVTTGRREGSS
mmetsp:Transcript_27007/g.67277  ORF Transcript_27007/g.67277 Transcript_27007/m.67277 type:complete len:214 (-) Transcript_27007:452-1093(-)